jgi:HAD superfamily hydrolase (TIGR01509 family)
MDQISAIIFDMDGVLLDTERICRICWTRAAREFGMEDIDRAYKSCVGTNVNDTIEILKKQYGAEFDACGFYDRTSDLFHAVEKEQGIPLMPSVRECLDTLRATRMRIAVASSTRTQTVYRQLRAAGLFDYFETITCGDTVVHSKPAPDIYLNACASLGLPPQLCIAVEDSPNGIRSAYSAGMKCIMVPDQIEPTDDIRKLSFAVCESLAELPSVIACQ